VRGTRTRAPRLARVAVVVALTAAAALPVATGTAGAVARAPGTGPAPAGTGIGTAAAYANPLCDRNAGTYGRLQFVTKQGYLGSVCVAKWKGTNNGGATYQGVTKDAIRVVALVPNDQQIGAVVAKSQLPLNNATGQPGSMENAIKDTLAPFQKFFETYGRTVEIDFVTSTGDDEAAQRADAVTVVAEKPFAVIDTTFNGEPVFGAAVGAAKIPVWGNDVSLEDTLKQAPYRWGQADANAGAINVAEFAGKQLAGKKAVYAGDTTMHDQTRKLGMVYSPTVIDTALFDKTLAKYGAKLAPGAVINYPSSNSPFGDPTVAQEQAGTAITKLKTAGVTTVMLLTDSAMITAMLKQANSQDYHPEWIIAGYQYTDLAFFARNYDQNQWAHAFGISNIAPPVVTTQTGATLLDPVQWYWGKGRGTSSVFIENIVNWLMQGIMYAGPKLTPQTFEQGYFAVPATGGSVANDVYTVQQGFGRTDGLPYDEYLHGNKDFTVVWWDPNTVGPPLTNLGLPGGQGTLWYLDGGKRYYGAHWPTTPLKFFDKSNATYELTVPATSSAQAPCTGCPSETGQGQPSS